MAKDVDRDSHVVVFLNAGRIGIRSILVRFLSEVCVCWAVATRAALGVWKRYNVWFRAVLPGGKDHHDMNVVDYLFGGAVGDFLGWG